MKPVAYATKLHALQLLHVALGHQISGALQIHTHAGLGADLSVTFPQQLLAPLATP